MADVKTINMGFGSVSYQPSVPERPTTTETTHTAAGKVVVNNIGAPEVPGYMEVTFMLSVTHDESGIEFSNIFSLDVIIPDMKGATSYAEIEAEGARRLAPMLRAIADAVEKDVARVEAKQAAVEAEEA